MAIPRFPKLRCIHAWPVAWALGGVPVLVGCGRVGFSTVDASADARSDAAAVGDCWAKWRSGAPPLSPPSLVGGEINTDATEKNPFLTADRTTLYFSSNRAGGLGKNDFWRATREPPDGAFGTAQLVTDLNSKDDDGRFEMAPDGVTGVLSSLRESTDYQLWIATRSEPPAEFTAPTRLELTPPPEIKNAKDPHFSSDGTRLYFSSDSTRLFASERSGTVVHGVTVLPGLDNVDGIGDPNLAPDELTIVFSKQHDTAKQDLYVATRSATTEPFAVHTPLPPGINTDHVEQDAFVTGDGCELWFASDRGGAGFDIYLATIAR